jgi:hypothetical protein
MCSNQLQMMTASLGPIRHLGQDFIWKGSEFLVALVPWGRPIVIGRRPEAARRAVAEPGHPIPGIHTRGTLPYIDGIVLSKRQLPG